MNNKVIGRLSYNSKEDRFGIISMNAWLVDGLHCGEVLEYYDDATHQWIEDRIEYDDGWYFVNSHKQGSQLVGLEVQY